MPNIDFTPKPAVPAQEVTAPQPMAIGSPEWVVATWQRLYYQMPSPGLKQRVAEAEQWAKEQAGNI